MKSHWFSELTALPKPWGILVGVSGSYPAKTAALLLGQSGAYGGSLVFIMLGITTDGTNIDLTCGFKSDINFSIGFVKATSGKERHSCRDLSLFIRINV